ncbi:UNVERIFIED_CONTAM: hypothetical protein ABIE34_000333 [Jeotgalibacillus campisalis]
MVSVGGSDTSNGEKSIRTEGVMLSLLGAAEPVVLHEWFNKLADGGRIVTHVRRNHGAHQTAR